MKITPRNAEAFVRSPDPSLRAVLVYGPDAGLVRERVEALVKAAAEDPADPFRVSELGAREIVEDPARLGDEAAALSLSGGRRAVRLRQAGDDLAPHFKDFFAAGWRWSGKPWPASGSRRRPTPWPISAPTWAATAS